MQYQCVAEDVVSATFLAILEKPDSFEGRRSLRTYAIGILNFKIIDEICAELCITPTNCGVMLYRARLRYHFVICATCRTVDGQTQFLRHAMREMDMEQKGAPSS